jgi:triosephosphate isomerase (TIM)
MRKPILAGNWKMHKTIREAHAFMEGFLPLVSDVTDREIVICPTFTALAALSSQVSDSVVRLGAQNMHWEVQGAYTGEIAPGMLKDAGCQYVILGHSERRQYFAETNEIVNKKVKAALANRLVPIFCVGETLAEREAGQTEILIEIQVREGLAAIAAVEADKIVIAYEPVWAIGTGRSATSEDANNVIRFIRGVVTSMFGNEVSQAMRILYGGSVKPETIAELMGQSDIDGALVGGASLDAAGFAKIVKY